MVGRRIPTSSHASTRMCRSVRGISPLSVGQPPSGQRFRVVLRARQRRVGAAGSCDAPESARSLTHLPQGMPGATPVTGSRFGWEGTGVVGDASVAGRRRSSRIFPISSSSYVLAMSAGSRPKPKTGRRLLHVVPAVLHAPSSAWSGSHCPDGDRRRAQSEGPWNHGPSL